MPHSAASDLGLHCLQMSLLWDLRLKQVFHSRFYNDKNNKIINVFYFILNHITIYHKCRKILYTHFSDKRAYANKVYLDRNASDGAV